MQIDLPEPLQPTAFASGIRELARTIVEHGHVFVPARAMADLLAACGPLYDWSAFAASWNDLPLDTYMGDQGRYRRRRHAVYRASIEGGIVRSAHQPHYQALDYNPLNGGIERWFEAIDARLGDGASMRTILQLCHSLFDSMVATPGSWRIEAHQFRIEARLGSAGLPTPEGMHRDGTDYVLVLLVSRRNIDSGTTLIGSNKEGFTSSFTLTEPLDCSLLDDHRVYHGVTPVQAIDPSQPAHRDVLVVTFQRA